MTIVIFSADKVQAIHAEAVRLDLQNRRIEMLFGLNAEYVSGLRQVANPAGQLLSDLDSMNNVDGTVSGVALERWLRNAAYAMRMIPDKQKFFDELADEVIRRVLPASLARLYQPMKAAFGTTELIKILNYDLGRDATNFSLLRGKEDSVLCLLQEAEAQGQSERLVKALRDAQSDNREFVSTAENALKAIDAGTGTGIDGVVLPPCDNCWWRVAKDAGDIAINFREHISDVRKDANLRNTTEDLTDSLARETPSLAFGAAIVETANIILSGTFGNSVRGKLITVDFDSKYIDNAWAGVFVEAAAKGPATLVALFLAIFLKGGVLSGIADVNLMTLMDANEIHGA